jgi:Uncharacterized protein conserved in bacteria (DUF2325)
MCKESANCSAHNAKPLVLPVSSRRVRLWELPVSCHCPLIGISMPVAVIRAIARKIIGSAVKATDYEMHSSAVSYCASRNGISEAIQKDLDNRYVSAVSHFKSAKTTLEVKSLWGEAVERLDLSGPLWAALTHSHCDAELRQSIYQTVHMLQHQAGSEMREMAATHQALALDKLSLTEEVKNQQERARKHQIEKLADREKAAGLLDDERMRRVVLEAKVASLSEQLEKLATCTTNTVPPAATFHAEYWKNKYLTVVAQIKVKKNPIVVEKSIKKTDQSQHQAQTPQTLALASSVSELPPQNASTMCLNDKAVLCVGGRNKTVPMYRTIIESAGGKFTHHDGGVEHNVALLEPNMAAADLVICQTGCISHKSYFRVKDFCKRNGKQCVYVENPSASSLCRRLEEESISVTALDKTNLANRS